ncbi:helveticin J family class III bacteriocin [Lentilactobacillus kosonis]|uniref:Uncharacterized protein n=1 Tax=Lentilactobacillus kosonis TaxID=2810561 RepID=A0A401FPV2_9LACO|nr:helveticin J family class III bacteriocin [Lentilactobacillus kosonis]GAY74336.1 hypothetical protein NBRC111893_2482 [Lentilactobacillus kosonis]
MVTATQRYTLKFHTTNKVVQKCYLDFDGGYAYALQMPKEDTKDTLLSRAPIGNSTTLDFTDYMMLNNFGHVQTFEVFTDDDGSKWAWVATYASSTEKDSIGDQWASRIGVIPLDGTAKMLVLFIHLLILTT